MQSERIATVIGMFSNMEAARRAVAELKSMGFHDDQIRLEDRRLVDGGAGPAAAVSTNALIAGLVVGALLGALIGWLVDAASGWVLGAIVGGVAGLIVGWLVGSGMRNRRRAALTSLSAQKELEDSKASPEAHDGVSQPSTVRAVVGVGAHERHPEVMEVISRHGGLPHGVPAVGEGWGRVAAPAEAHEIAVKAEATAEPAPAGAQNESREGDGSASDPAWARKAGRAEVDHVHQYDGGDRCSVCGFERFRRAA